MIASVSFDIEYFRSAFDKKKLAVWMNKWFVSVGQNKKDKLQRDTF